MVNNPNITEYMLTVFNKSLQEKVISDPASVSLCVDIHKVFQEYSKTQFSAFFKKFKLFSIEYLTKTLASGRPSKATSIDLYNYIIRTIEEEM